MRAGVGVLQGKLVSKGSALQRTHGALSGYPTVLGQALPESQEAAEGLPAAWPHTLATSPLPTAALRPPRALQPPCTSLLAIPCWSEWSWRPWKHSLTRRASASAEPSPLTCAGSAGPCARPQRNCRQRTPASQLSAPRARLVRGSRAVAAAEACGSSHRKQHCATRFRAAPAHHRHHLHLHTLL